MSTVNRFAVDSAPVLTPAHWRTIAASEARATGNTETWDWEQAEGSGLVVVIDASAVTAGASLVFTVQGVDPVSGAVYDIVVAAAITTVSTKVLRIFPGATAAANLTVNDVVPPRLRVKVVPADNKSVTYTITALHTA